MKNKISAIEWSMKYKAIPLSLGFVLVLVGFYALFNMPRNEFPDFTVRQGLIIGSYPGASTQQVEEQLTNKVEEYLFSFNEVNKTKTYSYSLDGMMYIYVEVDDRINRRATQEFWNKLKSGILIFQQTDLPKEVRGIMVNSDFGSTAAVILAVESKTRPYKDLKEHVTDIEDNLRQIDDMAKISHSGDVAQQISIYIDNDKLAQYGISAGSLMQQLQNEGAIAAAGVLEGDLIDRPIHITDFFKTESDLAGQIIRKDGDNIIRLRDVATIKKEYATPDSYVTVNGTKCIIITMEMATGKNIVHFGEKVSEKLRAIEENLPADIKITNLADQPEVVATSISHFMKEFGFALIGVIIVALLLLPFRIASVAAGTIPITIAATLAILYICGIELNTVTLAALIIVLGIVVDDPIVVIDNHVEKLDHGQSVWDAAKNSAKELFPSVFTATLAISATFLPLVFFMEGIASDFISAFPYTIMIALFLSLLISILIVPFFNTIFIKKGLHKEEKTDDKKSFLDHLQGFFNKRITSAFKKYKLTLFLGAVSIVLGIILMGFISQQLFPKVERDQFAIEISLAKGYNLSQTDSVAKKVEKILSKDERIVSYTSFIGSSSPRFHTLYAPKLPAENYAQILVNTTSEEATEEVLREYDEKYSDIFPEAYVRMKQLDMVSASAPIEVRIYGQDLEKLKEVGDQVMALARETPRIIWTRTDFGNMYDAIDLDIKTDEAARLGLTKNDIANTVAMNMEGVTATRIWEDDYPVDVKIKTNYTDSHSNTNLGNISIIVPQDKSTIPLRQVVNIKPEYNQEQIAHRNGMRVLTVRADIDKDAVPSKVLGALKPKIDELKLPDSLFIDYGGEYEMQQENLGPMGLSLLMSVVIIFLILLWHFKSIKHAFLSFMTMPLSIFGAALGLLLMDYPFGFTSFLGILALCGIVVRNGIILIDFADEVYKDEGVSRKQAAIMAAQRRMRPIFLTSSAAAVGVIPMIISRSSLWGPLGTVICFGLMMSMVLTLFVLPVLYWMFFRSDDTNQDKNETIDLQKN